MVKFDAPSAPAAIGVLADRRTRQRPGRYRGANGDVSRSLRGVPRLVALDGKRVAEFPVRGSPKLGGLAPEFFGIEIVPSPRLNANPLGVIVAALGTEPRFAALAVATTAVLF